MTLRWRARPDALVQELKDLQKGLAQAEPILTPEKVAQIAVCCVKSCTKVRPTCAKPTCA